MHKKKITLTINDMPCEYVVSPNETLLDVIREKAGLTGTKRGCDNGMCGACTVLLEGVPVNSCCILAMQADGKRVETIESLSRDGKLHPIQEAFVEENAIQCGYCIPGMEMSTKALLERNAHPSDDDIREALSGNLCRCTGYVKIINAVKSAANKMGEVS